MDWLKYDFVLWRGPFLLSQQKIFETSHSSHVGLDLSTRHKSLIHLMNDETVPLIYHHICFTTRYRFITMNLRFFDATAEQDTEPDSLLNLRFDLPIFLYDRIYFVGC